MQEWRVHLYVEEGRAIITWSAPPPSMCRCRTVRCEHRWLNLPLEVPSISQIYTLMSSIPQLFSRSSNQLLKLCVPLQELIVLKYLKTASLGHTYTGLHTKGIAAITHSLHRSHWLVCEHLLAAWFKLLLWRHAVSTSDYCHIFYSFPITCQEVSECLYQSWNSTSVGDRGSLLANSATSFTYWWQTFWGIRVSS